MTFDEFVSKWSNQQIDFDGVYPNQCMDLMHQYVYDVLGITDKTVLAAPAAYQAYTNFNKPDLFDKIDNTPTGVPQKGDIVFFGQDIGEFGHVCIFVDGDTKKFNSFDANWPTGSLPHIQNHNYTGVLGWLRPKAQEVMATISQKELDQIRADRDSNYTDLQNEKATVVTLNSTIADLHQQLTTKDQEISNLKTQLLNETSAKETAQNQANQNGNSNDLYVQLKQDYDKAKIDWNAQFSKDKQQISTLQNKLNEKKPKNFFDKIIYIFT